MILILKGVNDEFAYIYTFNRQARYHLGTEEVPPRVSTLRRDRGGHHHPKEQDFDSDNDDGVNSEGRDNSRRLPNKVDAFVQYINDTYLDGSLETADLKSMFKDGEAATGGGGGKGGNRGRSGRRRIYNGDDDRASSPFSRRTLLVED